MAPAWLACCLARNSGYDEVAPLLRKSSSSKLTAANWPAEADLVFFDCCETILELQSKEPQQRAGRVPRLVVPPRPAVLDEGTPVNARMDCLTAVTVAANAACEELVGELAEATKVLEQTRTEWSRRVMECGRGLETAFVRPAAVDPAVEHLLHQRQLLSDALAELQWADLSQARRMLKANIGDVQKAVAMFVQALELRVRDREIFVNLRCDVRCDMRILGSDLSERPVVYLCARSQTAPLRCIRDQFILTLEQACKMSGSTQKGEGRLYLIADMHGLQTTWNMDAAALQDLAEMCGTVFADRICKIVIVDFSRAAQAAWWMLKQMLSPVTREKFAFVGTAKALEICRLDLDGATFERLQETLEVNRDPAKSPEEILNHARRTTVHEVPLGPPQC